MYLPLALQLKEASMELKIYKGFGIDFLSELNINDALIPGDVSNKLNVLLFDVKLRKKLDASLTLLDDNDSKWITYEEYSLIKERVALSVDDYGLKATVIVNNLMADVFPLPFVLDEKLFFEVKQAENSEKKENLSDEAKKIVDVYSSLLKVDEVFYGTFYNYEYDKTNKVDSVNYYPSDIKVLDLKKESDLPIYINDDLESYLRILNHVRLEKPKTISIRDTGTRASKRIVDSIYAYCKRNNIQVLTHYEELKKDDPVVQELINIAKNDLKIPGFQAFRNIKFYKNPDLDNEIIEISQAQIIKEIINQAENSYDEKNNHTFRDVFITAFTGAGKSVMFQVPAVYLAKKYKKLTIIIEPVIALMEDQKDALIARGYKRVEAFNSNLISQVERDNVLKRVKDGEIDLLYLSPETLLSYSLETIIGDREIGLLIVDEAHIVTTWGVGFRPDYWYLGGYINNVRHIIQSGHKNKDKKIQHFPICAFTATAINGGVDDSVNETIISLYMENPVKYIGYARRDDISFDITIKEENKLGMTEYESKKGNDLISKVSGWIANKEKTIVYFPYATYAKDAFKGFKGFAGAKYTSKDVGLYTGRNIEEASAEIFKTQKQETFEKFRSGEITVMFATKAFGMGVDVNDIKNVYHYAVTGNLCDYVQEIGRAARKVGMDGYAITDFYSNDLTFMQRLFGMSQIRQYQINKVLSGVYDVYKNKMQRSFLISPQSFTYIFSGGTAFGEDAAINKLKTCLLMLEKDFYDKYNFKVLISRPQSVFTKAYVCIIKENVDDVLNSKYGKAFKFVAKGRDHWQVPGTDNEWISDRGDIYSIDLKELWETYYSNLSFPQFKFWYFCHKDYYGKDKVDVLKEIQPYIFARQKVTVQVKNDKVFADLRSAILADLTYVNQTLYSTFKKKYFTLEEFANSISKQFGKTKARIIANSIFDLVDPSHKVVKPRNTEDMSQATFMLANGTFDSYLKKPILRSGLVKSFTGNYTSEYSQFTSISPDDVDAIALKILSIFDYISYEIVGGEQPEIFIRLNDPNKVAGIVTGAIKYSNNYVTTAKEKHDRDVKVLYKFFIDLKQNKERWDYIEKYFLGYNVSEGSGGAGAGSTQVPLKKMVDDVKSSPSIAYKDWTSASILFDDSQLAAIKEFGEKSIPMPDYFHTKIKGGIVSEDPIMSWPDKNVLIFSQDTTDADLAECKNRGWKAFRILEVDADELLEEVM